MSTQKHFFQKLTPIDDANLGVYEDALEYAFANVDVCNIAISGAYGAGKSSVIETYQKKHPERIFLHISLAHFTDMGTGKGIDAAELEGKIINQLAHQVSPDKIPQTNFVMKRKPDADKVQKYTVFAVVFILLLCFLWFNDVWCNLVNGLSGRLLRSLLDFTTAREMMLLAGMVCIAMFAYLCYGLIKQQMNRNILKKINVKGEKIDFELFDGGVESYFDKYLDEVLYLFESVNVDAVLFEDLDRYDINLIFEKLREINTLLNRRIKMFTGGRTEPIRFIYQMRDDMFLTKERTKFFDFIIPIVPVVDGSNALDKFLEYFSQSGIVDLFDEDFLQDLSLYVDDMRILKNICNEFLVYHEKLQESPVERDDNKLLAMITYKNIFPKDFANLQVMRGYVYRLFEGKEQFIKEKVEKLQTKIKDLEREEAQAVQERSRSIDELDAMYFVENRPIKVEGKLEDEFHSRVEFMTAIKKNNYDVMVGTPGYYSDYAWKKVNIKAQFDALTSNTEYATRKRNLENRANGQRGKRQVELLKYRRELENIQMSYLKYIITKENTDAIFDAPFRKEINGVEEYESMKKDTYFPLIKYLIKEGYIDETYPDYMTFFYENSITKQDKIFLRSIKEEKAKGPEHPLQNVKVVIKRMRLMDFDKEECWNYNLLDELLVNQEQYQEQLRRMMNSLYNWEPVEFVDGYIRRRKNLREFSGCLNEVWVDACLWILKEEKFSEDARRQYILHTLCKKDEAVLNACNQENELAAYISGDADFLYIREGEEFVLGEADKDNLINSLDVLDAEFSFIDMNIANQELVKEVYECGKYELNKEMITIFLTHMYQIPFSGKYLSQRLTLILSQEQPLAGYVKDNLNDYIRMQIKEGGALDESEETVLYVLNDEKLDMDLKVGFIRLLVTVLSKLRDIKNEELWTELLVNNVSYSQENLFDYFYLSSYGMDEKLTSYINDYEGSLALDISNLEEKYGENSASILFREIIKNNRIENSRYRQLLKALNRYYNNFAVKNIAKDKMQILIQDRVIRMTLDNLHFLRENYKDSVQEFIEVNVREYFGIISAEELVPEEVAYVLGMDITDASKIKLLELETNPRTVMHKKYSEAVTAHILQHNPDEEERGQLYHWYPADMPKVREVIRQIAIEDMEEIVSMKKSMHSQLLDSLLKDEQVALEDKKQILANGLRNLSKEQVREYLRLLHLQEFDELFEGKRPTFSVTESNEALLTAFLDNGWISSFDVDKEDSDLYRAYGRKGNPNKIKIG